MVLWRWKCYGHDCNNEVASHHFGQTGICLNKNLLKKKVDEKRRRKTRKPKSGVCTVLCHSFTFFFFFFFFWYVYCPFVVPAGSPSHGGDVAVYGSDINQPSLPIPFYTVLVSVSVFIVLSTVFHFTKSPDNSPLSHSVLKALFLPYWSFQLYISLRKSPLALTG